jgi:hypothetical protein
MPFPAHWWPGNTRCGRIAIQGGTEGALNQKVKNLIRMLGEAIHESVSESEHIAGVVKNIRDQGFDVMLMLEATIGLNQVEPESGAAPELSGGEHSFEFTSHDLSFLKSLRISLPDAPAESESEPSANDVSLDPPAGPAASSSSGA